MVRMRKNRLAWALALVVALVAVVCLAPGLARAVTADAGTDVTTETVVDATSEDSTSDDTGVTDATVADDTTVDSAGTDATAEQDAQTDEVTTEEDASSIDAVSTLAVEPFAAGAYWGRCGTYKPDRWTSEKTVYWVVAGESFTIQGSSDWNSSNRNALTRSGTTWTAGNVSDVTVVTLRYWGQTMAYVVVIPSIVEGNTYLRFDNSIPNTLTDQAPGLYGPSGNDEPYNQVTVEIKKVIDNGGTPFIEMKSTDSAWVYFSFESREGSSVGGTDEYRKQAASDYWNTVIAPSANTDDLNNLYSHFASGNYFGYVLKKESGTWHIDGALTTDPPVYVVDVYQNGTPLFLMSRSGESVDFNEFVQQLSDYLSADEGSLGLTQSGTDSANVTFRRGGVTYTCTIDPYGTDEVRNDSAIYVNRETFAYHEVTENIYYLCQLNISEPVATNGTLTISKHVEGDAANVNEHFTFTLSASGLNGEYGVVWEGNSDQDSNHPSSVTFSDGKATIELCHGESAAISLPAGTKVYIVETRTAAAGTTTTAQVDDGVVKEVGSNGEEETDSDFRVTVPAGENTHVAFTNEANLQPQTGISNNTAPMIGLLAVAGVGAAAVIAKRHSGKRGEDAWEE
ncbi:hypothetical protein [Thermophilibacter provencensis]|uniref:DUF7601 domain-containing protein n=1 Tax=Thermophilibacter provencensis TaxID=1852386 RepID=UPI003AA98F6B